MSAFLRKWRSHCFRGWVPFFQNRKRKKRIIFLSHVSFHILPLPMRQVTYPQPAYYQLPPKYSECSENEVKGPRLCAPPQPPGSYWVICTTFPFISLLSLFQGSLCVLQEAEWRNLAAFTPGTATGCGFHIQTFTPSLICVGEGGKGELWIRE